MADKFWLRDSGKGNYALASGEWGVQPGLCSEIVSLNGMRISEMRAEKAKFQKWKIPTLVDIRRGLWRSQWLRSWTIRTRLIELVEIQSTFPPASTFLPACLCLHISCEKYKRTVAEMSAQFGQPASRVDHEYGSSSIINSRSRFAVKIMELISGHEIATELLCYLTGQALISSDGRSCTLGCIANAFACITYNASF